MENYAMNYEEGKKIYTVADIEALPEGEHAELIDGEMFMMASPTMTHQRISRKLMVSIDELTISAAKVVTAKYLPHHFLFSRMKADAITWNPTLQFCAIPTLWIIKEYTAVPIW